MVLRAGRCYVACVGAGEFEWCERLAGPWARGDGTPRTGAMRGARDATHIQVELTVKIENVPVRVDGAGHYVRLRGFVRIDGLLARTACAGEGRLFAADADVGMKRCEYRLEAASAAGPAVRLEATCFVRPGRATRGERDTWYVRVLSVADPATVIGAGVIRRRALDRWRAADARWRRFVEREVGVAMTPVAS